MMVVGRPNEPDEQIRGLIRVAVGAGTPICPVVVRRRETAAGPVVDVRLLPALHLGST